MNHIREIAQLPTILTCFECENPIFRRSAEEVRILFENYINGVKEFTCRSCNKIMDTKELILHNIKGLKHSRPTMVLGFKISAYVITLRRDEVYIFDLEQAGIPNDALIGYIQYTAAADKDKKGFKPIDITEKDGKIVDYSHIRRIYPMIGDDKTNRETEICVAVFWIPNAQSNNPWNQLLRAFTLYEQNYLQEFVIPANIAFESKLDEIIRKIINKNEPKFNIKQNKISIKKPYNHKLNENLKIIANILGIDRLEDNIMDLLNKLREQRNEIAHNGSTQSTLTKDNAAELLTAVVFGFHYLNIIEESIDK